MPFKTTLSWSNGQTVELFKANYGHSKALHMIAVILSLMYRAASRRHCQACNARLTIRSLVEARNSGSRVGTGPTRGRTSEGAAGELKTVLVAVGTALHTARRVSFEVGFLNQNPWKSR